jgi:hypothetical protein
MLDDLEYAAQRVRRVLGAMTLLMVLALAAVLWGMWSWTMSDDVASVAPPLPPDTVLAPPPRDLPTALEALTGPQGLFIAPVDQTLETLREARLAGCTEVAVFTHRPLAAPSQWVAPADGLGWGSHGASHTASETLRAQLSALVQGTSPDAVPLVKRLGRPDQRQREPIHETRGGPIFPGGPEFRKARQVKIGDEDILTYQSAGIVLRIRDGKVVATVLQLSRMPGEPTLEEALAGRWIIDRDAYTAMVQDLITSAPDERWRAEYEMMAEHIDDFELILDLGGDGSGTAMWWDLVWMSHPDGFRIGWQRGVEENAALRWSPGPGGLRLIMAVEGGGNRVVGLAHIDGRLKILTRHPRELRLVRAAPPSS